MSRFRYTQGDLSAFPGRFNFKTTEETKLKAQYLGTLRMLTPSEHETVRERFRALASEGKDPFRCGAVTRCPNDMIVHLPGVPCPVCHGRSRVARIADDGGDLE